MTEKSPATTRYRFCAIVVATIVAAMGFIALFSWSYFSNPILGAINDELGPSGLHLLSRLGAWEAALGPPEVVEQAGGVHTFFYWPDRGVAVGCHPHFEGQATAKDTPDWRVTSIFLALRRDAECPIPPASVATTLRFWHTTGVVVDGRPIAGMSVEDFRSLFLFEQSVSSNEVDLSNFPVPVLGYTRTTLYLVAGQPALVEVAENNLLFSHYD